MKTVILGPLPQEVEALIERRRVLGQDHLDEVWNGEYHMAPAPTKAHAYVDDELATFLHGYARRAGLFGSGPFNLGAPEDYRVPDRGLHRDRSDGTWASTAAMVVESVSPGDETFDKFGFYAHHGVEEILGADPETRTIRLWALDGDRYLEAPVSRLLQARTTDIAEAVDWP
jgi:Uma2 family endonuclease